MRRLKSVMLVSVQFICLGILLFTGPFIADNVGALIPELVSILLGLWAIRVMSNSKLNIFPDVRAGASLITAGPYKLIRHPMYLAVILLSFSLLIEKFSLIRIIACLILLADLIYKIEFEEKELDRGFENYMKYKQKSKKLIPFVY